MKIIVDMSIIDVHNVLISIIDVSNIFEVWKWKEKCWLTWSQNQWAFCIRAGWLYLKKNRSRMALHEVGPDGLA